LSVNIGFDNTNTPSLLYIPVQFDQMRVAALIDTGSSICVLSKDLYNQLPERFKLSFEQVNQDIRLASNSNVEVFGLAKILVEVPQGKREIDVYQTFAFYFSSFDSWHRIFKG
jgi:regulatory protein YycI of two-component signal transduction system YycFG